MCPMGEERSVKVIDLHFDALRFNRQAFAQLQRRSKSDWSTAQTEVMNGAVNVAVELNIVSVHDAFTCHVTG